MLDFQSDPKFKLQLESLEIRKSGVELRNSRITGEVMHATVFVPEGKLGVFVRKIEAYADENTKTGRPKNRLLVESISEVRLASLKSFWTDAGEFPGESSVPYWWEVWLREPQILTTLPSCSAIVLMPSESRSRHEFCDSRSERCF